MSQEDPVYPLVKGIPLMKESFVVFIDILGFGQFVGPDVPEEQQASTLTRLHRALHRHVPYLTQEETSFGRSGWYASKVFTDNIVLARPLMEFNGMEGESELGHMMLDAASYQMALALEGFYVRGGIAVGKVFVDDLVAFGPALIEAHQLESQVAGVPRIVLSDGAVEYVRKHVGYYVGGAESAPQNGELLADEDGRLFINYLDSARGTTEEEFLPEYEHAIETHRDGVVRELRQHAKNRRTLDKYGWVGRYHNFVVNYLYPGRGDLEVPGNLVERGFRRLPEVLEGTASDAFEVSF